MFKMLYESTLLRHEVLPGGCLKQTHEKKNKKNLPGLKHTKRQKIKHLISQERLSKKDRAHVNYTYSSQPL